MQRKLRALLGRDAAAKYSLAGKPEDQLHRQKLFYLGVILDEGILHRLRFEHSKPVPEQNPALIQGVRQSLENRHVPVADAFAAAVVTSPEGQRFIAEREARLSRLRDQILRIPLNQIPLERLRIVAFLSKDLATLQHINNAAVIAHAIVQLMPGLERQNRGLSDLLSVFYAGKRHDEGKLRVPGDILRAPRQLTKDEFERYIMPHPINGEKILSEAGAKKIAREGARQHHKRVKGGGYPAEVMNEPHTETGKLMAVCDSLEAMTAGRYDRPGKTRQQAIEELEKGIGTQFDEYYARLAIRLLKGESPRFNKWWETRERRIQKRQDLEKRKTLVSEGPIQRVVDDRR